LRNVGENSKVLVSVSLGFSPLEFLRSVSLAHGDPLLHRAILTVHEATPVKLALAQFRSSLPYHVVTPTAAQISASVTAGARLVASATGGAGDVDRRIPLAEVRRFLIVEELLGQVPGFPLTTGNAVFAILSLLPPLLGSPATRSFDSVQRCHVAQIALRYQHGVPETVLQRLADYPEVRCDLPAGLQFARAGHAMALAAYLHVTRHRLQL